MHALTKEFKSEHAFLAETLGKIKAVGISSSEGKKLLQASKTALLAHLQKEDEQLYPVLKAAAQKDPGLERRLAIFAKDMESITKEAFGFFEAYDQGGDIIALSQRFGKLCGLLGVRINKEETILLADFEKIMNSRA